MAGGPPPEGLDCWLSPYRGPLGELYYFVKSTVREGILPRMVRSMLAARGAVKKLMAKETDPTMKQILDARQLGLKVRGGCGSRCERGPRTEWGPCDPVPQRARRPTISTAPA